MIDLVYQVREVRGVEATAAADLPQKHCQLFGNLFYVHCRHYFNFLFIKNYSKVIFCLVYFLTHEYFLSLEVILFNK